MPLSEADRRLWLGRLMGAAWIAAIAGITLALQALASALMDAGLKPTALPWGTAALNAACLCGWGLVAWIAHHWKKHSAFPRKWAVLAVVALGSVAILIYHMHGHK